MKVHGKSAKIICLIIGILFVCIALSAIVKDLCADKEKAKIVNILSKYTSSREVRAGNDGGRDSYQVYGEVVELSIEDSGEIFEVSIIRRNENSLPKAGDSIWVNRGDDEKWYEYEKELFSLGTGILMLFGVMLILLGIFGKVNEIN